MKDVVKNGGQQKLHKGMIETADKAIQGRGDGRISVDDAKRIIAHLENDSENLGHNTLNHIGNNYKVTDAAQTILVPAYSPQALPSNIGDVFQILDSEYNNGNPKSPNNLHKYAMNDPGSSTSDGKVVQLWGYDKGHSDNQWALFPNYETKMVGGKYQYWHIINMTSGLFLNPHNGEQYKNNAVVQYGKGKSNCERFDATWLLTYNQYHSCNRWDNGKSFGFVSLINGVTNTGWACCGNSNDLNLYMYDVDDRPYAAAWAFYFEKNIMPSKSEDPVPKWASLKAPVEKEANGTEIYTREALIPFYMVDDSHSSSWRIQNSPFYKLTRIAKWNNLDAVANDTGETIEGDYSETISNGFSTTDSETFSTKTGISVEAGVSDPAGPSFKVTASVEFGYSNTHSFTASVTKSETKGVKFPIPPHSIGFVWNIVTEYILHRADGSVVSSWTCSEPGVFVSGAKKSTGLDVFNANNKAILYDINADNWKESLEELAKAIFTE